MTKTHHPSSREERLKIKAKKKIVKPTQESYSFKDHRSVNYTVAGHPLSKRIIKNILRDQETKEELHAGSQ